jgi:hypothetical protein
VRIEQKFLNEFSVALIVMMVEETQLRRVQEYRIDSGAGVMESHNNDGYATTAAKPPS